MAGLAESSGNSTACCSIRSQNSRIRALIENLQAHLTRVGKLTEEIPGRIEASVDEHEAIVEAIAARDPDAAERYMSEHIRSVLGDQLEADHDAETAEA